MVASELYAREGVGDDVTNVITGELGVTQAARDAVGATPDTPGRVVALMYLKLLESRWEGVEGYKDSSPELKEALLDSSYNLGEGIFNYPRLRRAVMEGNEVWAVYELLDTAQVEGKSLKGLAKRRAEMYNKVAEVDIDRVEQEVDGTIVYWSSDETVLRFKPKGGRHEKSSVGSIPVRTYGM